MKLLSQGQLAVLGLVAALLLVTAAVLASPPLSLGFAGLGLVCFLVALGSFWSAAGGFQRMLDDLKSAPPKS